MELYTSEAYEALRQLSREDLLSTLQALYLDFMDGTKYDGQPDYVGDLNDLVSYGSAQAISQAMEMLMNIFDVLNELKCDDDEEEE